MPRKSACSLRILHQSASDQSKLLAPALEQCLLIQNYIARRGGDAGEDIVELQHEAIILSGCSIGSWNCTAVLSECMVESEKRVVIPSDRITPWISEAMIIGRNTGPWHRAVILSECSMGCKNANQKNKSRDTQTWFILFHRFLLI